MTRAARGLRRRRGFALADFVCGSLIFVGALLAFSTLTTSKYRLLDAGASRLAALAAAEAMVDGVRAEGLPALPQGEVDPDGFRQVATFTPQGSLGRAWGRIDARALRVNGGEDHGLLEVRVTVGWRDLNGHNQLSLSTVASRPAGSSR